jgi:hypothetical protein
LSKRVLLHIGTGKTGTGSIQNYLFHNRHALLLRHRLLYPSTGLEEVEHFGEKLFAHYPVVSWVVRRDRVQIVRLREEIEKADAEQAVVSCENFYHGLDSDDIDFLADCLDGLDIHIVCYVRRQDLYMESAWKQQVKVGELRTAFPVFLKRHTRPEYLAEVHANYFRMLKPWAEAFGRENIQVRVFDRTQWRNGDLIDDFLGLCDVLDGAAACSLPKPEMTNVAMPSELVRLICKINAMGLVPRDEQQALVGYLRSLREYNDPPLLTLADRHSIIHNYAASNEAMFREFAGKRTPPCFTEAALPAGKDGEKLPGGTLEDIAVKSLVGAWKLAPHGAHREGWPTSNARQRNRRWELFAWPRLLRRRAGRDVQGAAIKPAKPWPPVVPLPLGFEPNMKPRDVAALIRQHQADSKPMSIIRLGVGESAVIGYPDFTPAAEFEHFLRVFFGENALNENQKLEFVSMVRSAVRAADVIGVNGGDTVTKFTVIRHFLKHYELAGPDTLLTLPSLHRNFQELGLYEVLLRNQQEIGLITCRDVEGVLKKAFNIEKITTYKVPQEVAHAKSRKDVARHFPDRFEEIRRTLVVPKPGTLFLIGAGPLGKVYCQWVRERGGIGLDVGSMFDAWAGLATRRYMRTEAGDIDDKYRLASCVP